MTNDADRLAAIRARVDAATPGPWDTEEDGRYGRRVIAAQYREIAECSGYVQPMQETITNADFIAHAREDVPWLLERAAAADALAAACVQPISNHPGITECLLCWAEWRDDGPEHHDYGCALVAYRAARDGAVNADQ